MESNIANDNNNISYDICPECDKPFKHLIAHLKNTHKWDVADIFDFRKEQKIRNVKKDVASGKETNNDDDDDDELRYAARKVSEVELEVEATVRRAVDKALMMRALIDINATVGDVYTRIESEMRSIAAEAHQKYTRAGRDVIDGPRRDIMNHLHDILRPSCDHLRECAMHELCRIAGVLKYDITSLL